MAVGKKANLDLRINHMANINTKKKLKLISVASPTILCLQESKLASLDVFKQKSFLPPSLSGVAEKNADGSRGGLVTAWDPNIVSLSASFLRQFSLTTIFSSTTTDLSFTVTNVYAPSDHSLTDAFAQDMIDLFPLISGPWLVLGDFNLIRYPHEKNTPNFNSSLADKFNTLIHRLFLQELPLLDRRFTWTNK
jgi:exonuclease III